MKGSMMDYEKFEYVYNAESENRWFCGMIIPVPRFRRDTAALLPRGHKTPGRGE